MNLFGKDKQLDGNREFFLVSPDFYIDLVAGLMRVELCVEVVIIGNGFVIDAEDDVSEIDAVCRL